MYKINTARRWREAASLIVAVRNGKAAPLSEPKCSNYSVLMMQRGGTASFAKCHHVFPGGLLDKSDTQDYWISNVSRFLGNQKTSETLATLQSSACCNEVRAPPTFARLRQESEATGVFNLPAEVAFKICSLRETFEESGVLLARHVSDSSYKERVLDTGGNRQAPFAQPFALTMSDRDYWMEKVRGDAAEFFTMCQALDCVPDIWSIHLWSTWLTPSNAPKRFDTPFFITALQDLPDLFVNKAEHENSSWLRPSDATTAISNGEVLVGPPQAMELLRMAPHHDIDSLLQFAAQRARVHGSERCCPVRIKCNDSGVSLFLGDSQYGNYASGDELNCSALDLLAKSRHIHALLQYSPQEYRFFTNIPERRGHVFPKSYGACPTPSVDAT